MEYAIGRGKVGEGTVKYYIEQLATGFQWKSVLSVLGAMIASIEGFYGGLLWGFLSLLVLDSITGILKSIHKSIPITSFRLRASVTKGAAYMTLLTALIVTSKYETSFVPIVTATYYYFMFTEFKSILENVGEMGVKVPDFLNTKVDRKIRRTEEDEE